MFFKTTLPGPLDAGRLFRLKTCQSPKDLAESKNFGFKKRLRAVTQHEIKLADFLKIECNYTYLKSIKVWQKSG